MHLIPRGGGFIVSVKVVPGAARQRVAGAYADGIKVTVKAPAERGAANAAVVELLARVLQVAPENVRIVRGQTTPRKQVLIVGLPAELIQRRLLRE